MADTLIGQKYNMLTVLRRVDDRKVGNVTYKYYLCRCDCGKLTIVRGQYLTSKHTKSCGCQVGLKKEKVYIPRVVDEDGSRYMAMKLWQEIKIASFCVGNPLYNGVYICEEWRNFDNFYEWFLSYGYNEPCRIVFVTKVKIYSPANCKLVRKRGLDAIELPKLN